ncbi:MAG: SPOR domain-containing protein [Rhodospirillales bacterium]|nr:SPOR domain-containing protein [Rhodospirillales bacterium]
MTSNEEAIALEPDVAPQGEAATDATDASSADVGVVAAVADAAAAIAARLPWPISHSPSATPGEDRAPGAAGGGGPGDGGAPVRPTRASDVAAALGRWVGVARRMPAEAAASAGIAIAALTLAMLAGDGNGEFPGAAFERALQSHAPPAMASERPITDSVVPDAVLVHRLVENPAFEPVPAGEQGRQPPPPLSAPAASVEGADGSLAKGGARRAQEVLAAATPPSGRAAPGGVDPRSRQTAAAHETGAHPAAHEPPRQQPLASRALDAAPAAGGIEIQLIAVWRRDQAVDAWRRLYSENPDLLSGLSPVIVEPDGRTTTLYRLRVGPLASTEQAQARCAALGERRIDCMVVREGG